MRSPACISMFDPQYIWWGGFFKYFCSACFPSDTSKVTTVTAVHKCSLCLNLYSLFSYMEMCLFAYFWLSSNFWLWHFVAIGQLCDVLHWCSLTDFSGSVMLCDQRYNIKIAITMSTVMGRHQRLVMLLLRMLFCNPRRQKSDKQAANAYSVRWESSQQISNYIIKTVSEI